MPPRAPAPEPWNDAVRRATDATAADRPGGMDERCWDDVAMRGIIATVLYALHLRERQPVDAIGWPAVLWQLRDDERVAELVTAVLPRAGLDLARTAAPGDPVTECWRWLTRTWDPHAPVKSAFLQPALSPSSLDGWVPDAPEPRWGGMGRGIASGLPDPALEVCTHWAAGVVQRALITERRGHHAHDRVQVTSGAFAGHRGYVSNVGWYFDDASETVDGPAGYVVDLDDVPGTEDIDADQVEGCADLRWPRRPEGTLKDGPPPGLHDPLPPAKTCEEDLRELLGRACNPEVVPEQPRRRRRTPPSPSRAGLAGKPRPAAVHLARTAALVSVDRALRGRPARRPVRGRHHPASPRCRACSSSRPERERPARPDRAVHDRSLSSSGRRTARGALARPHREYVRYVYRQDNPETDAAD
ncbi:hypothetical protein OG528_29825 [Streptomyces platensis]|uniref:hypothetical protein n=1 Tax=Streptomyces platensis TaxID=58346 RepID=UPI0030DE137E